MIFKLRMKSLLKYTIVLLCVFACAAYFHEFLAVRFKTQKTSSPRLSPPSLPTSSPEKWETAKIPEKAPHRRIKVILLTHKHSGSSFLGTLLQSHPDVHYVYEPLHHMKDPDQYGARVGDKSIPLSTRTKSSHKDTKALPEPLDHLNNIFNCQLTATTKAFLFLAYDSRDMKALDVCLWENSKNSNKTSCYTQAQECCKKRKVSLVKTVRLAMLEAEEMMSTDPDIKVIFLVRDPRGKGGSLREKHFKRSSKGRRTLLSVDQQPKQARGRVKAQKEKLTKENNDNATKLEPLPKNQKGFPEHCKIISRDIKTLLHMSEEHKKRVLIVRYEDVAREPLRLTTSILSFFGLKAAPEVKMAVRSISASTGSKGYRARIVVQDSYATAIDWRTDISFSRARGMEAQCADVFKVMKYRIFPTEKALRNLSLSVTKPLALKGFQVVS